MRIAILTGAGAGKSDGLPLQTELFQRFFERARADERRRQLANDVFRFFATAFGDGENLPDPLPTFEEALGLLDLAITRDEGIGSPTHGTDIAGGDLLTARRNLLLALAASTTERRAGGATNHMKLISNLRDVIGLENVTFVTTNYDTLLDDAIETCAVIDQRGTGSLVDYGFRDLQELVTEEHTDRRSYQCLKIHGSLNWLYCPVCDRLQVTYGSEGATRLVDDPM